ncbi:MAG: UDP-diphosphatase [Bacteroidetes bacterium RIFCSPHIGHO2_02_FULL_44_7]|nr:MAG: UDP-diphosphatase [Bacteroidetes bacterium RIFCSPHIGHO2_02_FULL_44_7]
MSFLEALILGIVQGLTEFLPVSSSGHLELVKAIQGQNLTGESSMMMTVVLHFATALSTIVVFRKDLFKIIKGLFQFKANEEFYFSLKIILSMVPAAIIGLKYDDLIEQFFDGQILLVGSMLILTGLLLFLADRAKDSGKEVSFGHALIIGIAQAIAILPGISRSGATIGTSVLLGIDRSRATRFSFLMVVPLILGKIANDLMKDDFSTAGVETSTLLIGFIAAFATGIVACTWMIALVRRSKLSWFSYYCFAVGVAAIIWNYTR